MNTLFSLVVCGGDITFNSHGSISSPGSPGNYPPNRDCIWKLRAPPGKKIHLHFLTMQLEAHETCQYDYLAVRLNEKFLNFCVIESSLIYNIIPAILKCIADLRWNVNGWLFIGEVLQFNTSRATIKPFKCAHIAFPF